MNDDYLHIDQVMEYVWDHGLIELDDIIGWLQRSPKTDLEEVKHEVDRILEDMRKKAEDANLIDPEKEYYPVGNKKRKDGD